MTSDSASAASGRREEARRGFVVGLTNPKMVVFFTASLPQFVDRSRGHTTIQMLVLLAIYGVFSIICDASYGLAGGSLRRWTATAPRRIERLVGRGGVCVIGVGIALAFAQGIG